MTQHTFGNVNLRAEVGACELTNYRLIFNQHLKLPYGHVKSVTLSHYDSEEGYKFTCTLTTWRQQTLVLESDSVQLGALLSGYCVRERATTDVGEVAFARQHIAASTQSQQARHRELWQVYDPVKEFVRQGISYKLFRGQTDPHENTNRKGEFLLVK